MKEKFLDLKLRGPKLALVQHAAAIVRDYMADGYRLTLRQLYYQFVVRNLFPNEERWYDRLGSAVSDGRMAGLLDWDAIEDRIRQPNTRTQFGGIKDLVSAALDSYRLDRWRGQRYFVELWVEKDALAGVLLPLAEDYHVTLMVNRGYSSTSAMYDASKRMLAARNRGHEPVILYLGDHDPSGEDMVRDVRDRLQRFGADVHVHKVALTMAQVRRYNPPLNPAKLTDSRAHAYVAKYGYSSWEVDALPPDVLHWLIRGEFTSNIDRHAMQQVIDQEQIDKQRLLGAVENL